MDVKEGLLVPSADSLVHMAGAPLCNADLTKTTAPKSYDLMRVWAINCPQKYTARVQYSCWVGRGFFLDEIRREVQIAFIGE